MKQALTYKNRLPKTASASYDRLRIMKVRLALAEEHKQPQTSGVIVRAFLSLLEELIRPPLQIERHNMCKFYGHVLDKCQYQPQCRDCGAAIHGLSDLRRATPRSL